MTKSLLRVILLKKQHISTMGIIHFTQLLYNRLLRFKHSVKCELHSHCVTALNRLIDHYIIIRMRHYTNSQTSLLVHRVTSKNYIKLCRNVNSYQ
jgi:hypothetical protein